MNPSAAPGEGQDISKEALVGTWQQEMKVAVTGPEVRFDEVTCIQLSHHLNAKYRLCQVYFQTDYTVTTPVTNNKKQDSNAYLLYEMYWKREVKYTVLSTHIATKHSCGPKIETHAPPLGLFKTSVNYETFQIHM